MAIRQSISHTLVEEAKGKYAASSSTSAHSEEPETEDNIALLFSLCDSITDLCITLEKLDHVLQMKNIELKTKLKNKEKASPLTNHGSTEPSD